MRLSELLIIIAISLAFLVGLGFGTLNVPGPIIQQVEPVYRTGDITPSVPIWAVYEELGVLHAISLIGTDDGRLFAFSVDGAPVAYEEYEPPLAWSPINASILQTLKGR